MNEKKNIFKSKKNKMERKKFLSYIGISALSFSIFSVNPIKIFFSKSEKENKKIKVQINPLAVERKNRKN